MESPIRLHARKTWRLWYSVKQCVERTQHDIPEVYYVSPGVLAGVAGYLEDHLRLLRRLPLQPHVGNVEPNSRNTTPLIINIEGHKINKTSLR